MRNDLKTNCMEMMCEIWDTQKSTKRIRIFSNVFFTIVALGIVAACVMFEIPYNIVTDIVNEYKTNA